MNYALCMLFGILLMGVGANRIAHKYSLFGKRKHMAAIRYIAAICVPIGMIVITAGIIGNSQLAIGIVVGCNITMLTLLRGVSYMTRDVSRRVHTDFLYLTVISIVLLFLSNDGLIQSGQKNSKLTGIDGVLLLLFGICYLIIKLKMGSEHEDADLDIVKEKKEIFVIMAYFAICLAFEIVGGFLFAVSFVPIVMKLQLSQRNMSIIFGIILTVILLLVQKVGKNVDSVEKSVDKTAFISRREWENVDKQEELGVVVTGIINFAIILPVSCIIHTIQITSSNIFHLVILCGVYICYCLLNNIPSRWDRLKGSLLVTCFIVYTVISILW